MGHVLGREMSKVWTYFIVRSGSVGISIVSRRSCLLGCSCQRRVQLVPIPYGYGFSDVVGSDSQYHERPDFTTTTLNWRNIAAIGSNYRNIPIPLIDTGKR